MTSLKADRVNVLTQLQTEVLVQPGALSVELDIAIAPTIQKDEIKNLYSTGVYRELIETNEYVSEDNERISDKNFIKTLS